MEELIARLKDDLLDEGFYRKAQSDARVAAGKTYDPRIDGVNRDLARAITAIALWEISETLKAWHREG